MKVNRVLISGLIIASASLTTTIQAEGFFGKLFSSDSDGASFETMLTHVPADTAYMMGNKKPIPEEVMDFHMQRA